MNSLINDFIRSSEYQDGYGFFEGDVEVVSYARRITKNQIRNYKRHGKIPMAFVQWVENHLRFDENDRPSRHQYTRDDLLTLLRRSDYRSEQARSLCEHLYKNLILSRTPELHKSFAEGDFLWKNLDFYRVNHRTNHSALQSRSA